MLFRSQELELKNPVLAEELLTELNLSQIAKNEILGREFGKVDLSGGQWQKLAMARAFYHGGTFFLLDEPTSPECPAPTSRSSFGTLDGLPEGWSADRSEPRYKYQTVSLAIAPPNTSIEHTIFSKEQHPAAKQAALLHSDLVSVTGGNSHPFSSFFLVYAKKSICSIVRFSSFSSFCSARTVFPISVSAICERSLTMLPRI